jgi:molybdenum cofactor cytidylyltransferase
MPMRPWRVTDPLLHAAIILAAGGSLRLGQPKQLLRHEGETLVHRATRLALATAAADTIVVVGAEAQAVCAAVADLPTRICRCDNWGEGMSASLGAALRSLDASIQGVLIIVCDQPALTADHLMMLCNTWRKNPGRAVASGYADAIGVPALLPRDWFDQNVPQGDRGARALLRARADEVTVILNPALAIDIDSPADLITLR